MLLSIVARSHACTVMTAVTDVLGRDFSSGHRTALVVRERAVGPDDGPERVGPIGRTALSG